MQKKTEIVEVGDGNVVIKDRKIYKLRGDTSIIYLPEEALQGFNLGWGKSEVRTTVFVQLDELETFTYNYTTTLLPQHRRGEYAYKYYYLQIPARLVRTIESDIEDWGLEIEDLTAEVQFIQRERGLEALILLKPKVESD